MSATETSICNSALAKLGAERILSLDDNSERARILKEQYAKHRDELLYSHPWNFAIDRLALVEVTPAPAFKWAHKFQLPNDCLRVVATDIPLPTVEWAVEGRFLLCNYASVSIEYIKKVTEVGKFSPAFCELLALKIAADICYSITQSVTLSEQMLKRYEAALRTTRSYSAQESSGERVYADSWLLARR